jgi:hypothetical protein
LKKCILPDGAKPFTVIAGVFRGLKMEMNLQNALQLWAGFSERETYRWIWQFSDGCASGIDVGAAQGEFTLYLLKRTQASRVIAFDPDPEYEAAFTRNLGLNGLSEGGRLERLRRFVGTGANGTVRLDRLEGILSPCLVKVDVDGFEMDVLQGAIKLLQSAKVRLILETHSPSLENECNNFLRGLGYQTRIVKNAWWRIFLKEQRPIELNRWLVASNDPNSPV